MPGTTDYALDQHVDYQLRRERRFVASFTFANGISFFPRQMRSDWQAERSFSDPFGAWERLTRNCGTRINV